MSFKPYIAKPSHGYTQRPVAFVTRTKAGLVIKLNAAALRAMGGKALTGNIVAAKVSVFVDETGRQIGFGLPSPDNSFEIKNSNGQATINGAAKDAGLKLVQGKTYALESIDLPPVKWRIREEAKA